MGKTEKILDALYEAVLSSVGETFDHAECEFSYERADGKSPIVKTTFHYAWKGRVFSLPLHGRTLEQVSQAIPELHRLMEKSGQGNWDHCIMKFSRGQEGVKIKFHYPFAVNVT